MSLADPSERISLRPHRQRGNRIAEGIEHSTRHVFTGLNASSASGEFAVIVSELVIAASEVVMVSCLNLS